MKHQSRVIFFSFPPAAIQQPPHSPLTVHMTTSLSTHCTHDHILGTLTLPAHPYTAPHSSATSPHPSPDSAVHSLILTHTPSLTLTHTPSLTLTHTSSPTSHTPSHTLTHTPAHTPSPPTHLHTCTLSHGASHTPSPSHPHPLTQGAVFPRCSSWPHSTPPS